MILVGMGDQNMVKLRIIEAVKKLLREIDTLRHWEVGEEKKGNKWTPMSRKPSDATKEKHKRTRLRLQQRVIALMESRKK